MSWFYQDFKSENLCVLNTGPVTRDHVKPSQMSLSLMPDRYNIYIF